MSLVLGLETSCDETSAAVVEGGRKVLSCVTASQVDIHRRYGGVVPELASRRHLEAFLPVVDEALTRASVSPPDLDAVAVTVGPGLAGALVVGTAAASSLALAWKKRLVPVNHLEAHAYAAFLEGAEDADPPADGPGRRPRDLEPPFVVLIVSGGHTSLAELTRHVELAPLGETRDDAAGEAFDKVARLLGLGYPGGPAIDRLAADGDPAAVALPRPLLKDGGLDFSFSGLKTALVYHLAAARERGEPVEVADLAASFQAAVVDVLVEKAFRALRLTRCSTLAVTGGVAANRGLRRALAARAAQEGVMLAVPEPRYCTDNAAMVAGLAHFLLAAGRPSLQGPLRVEPSLALGGGRRPRGRRGARGRGGGGPGSQRREASARRRR
ncbi:MAG TPA: tRNA (adenosine(37)-N6)-threonylcarbamoyltransferase complex transferase subunit TsaD [Clostridiales bacterium]|nr:tRNA (adenosine(37)-N6)-threonylcarbamoyltransferase complex transferase subunit TsaD [Clostridiales bacterium]